MYEPRNKSFDDFLSVYYKNVESEGQNSPDGSSEKH